MLLSYCPEAYDTNIWQSIFQPGEYNQVECEEYRARVFTQRWCTGSDREPSHQADEGAPDTLSLLILLHAETKNGGKRNVFHRNIVTQIIN
jgi:hypothetical protein